MAHPQTASTRFYISSDFSLDYRRARSLRWSNQTTAHYILITCVTGSLEYGASSFAGNLSTDESLIVAPNVGINVKAKDVEVLVLNLSASLVIPHAISMGLIPPQSTVTFDAEPIKLPPALRGLLMNLITELVATDAGREIVMHALVQQIVVRLLRSYSRIQRSPDLELSRVGLLDRRIRRSVELMHSQVDQDLTLKDLAAASYLSPFHFARLFKKLTGITPHNYLAQIRVTRAKELLVDPTLSINEVGARVGYLSASHFSKAFRLATGTTPREFRRGLVAQQH